MAVCIHISCDGEGCRSPKLIGSQSVEFNSAWFATTETVETWRNGHPPYSPDNRSIMIETSFFDLPEGWVIQEIEISKRYPDGLRFLCPSCALRAPF